ncbi:MAG: hypothetical protein ABII82_20700 [Verrucomicrobiota bacterium]
MKHPILSVCLALLLLAGCKFEAPLTEKPTRDVDPALLGSWFSLSDGKPLDVFKLSRQEYLVIDDGEPLACTHSDLAGTNFVSCRQLANDTDRHGKHAYIAYTLKGDELVISLLSKTPGLRETMSAEEIRAALAAAVKAGTALDPESRTRYRKKS